MTSNDRYCCCGFWFESKPLTECEIIQCFDDNDNVIIMKKNGRNSENNEIINFTSQKIYINDSYYHVIKKSYDNTFAISLSYKLEDNKKIPILMDGYLYKNNKQFIVTNFQIVNNNNNSIDILDEYIAICDYNDNYTEK